MKLIVETAHLFTQRLNQLVVKLLFVIIFYGFYYRFLFGEYYRFFMWRLVESFTRLRLNPPMASRLMKVLERVQQHPSRITLAGNNKLLEVN